MIKKILYLIVFINIFFLKTSYSSEKDIYKKIDLFGEVLEKINEEYVDEINLWIHIQVTCHQKLLMKCKRIPVENLEGSELK